MSALTTPPVEKSPIMNLSLQEILIIGNCTDQVCGEIFKKVTNGQLAKLKKNELSGNLFLVNGGIFWKIGGEINLMKAGKQTKKLRKNR